MLIATSPNRPNAKSENAIVTTPNALSSGARRTARSTSRNASFTAPSSGDRPASAVDVLSRDRRVATRGSGVVFGRLRRGALRDGPDPHVSATRRPCSISIVR